MKLNDILDNLAEKAGIRQINAMQQVMASTASQHVMLLAPTGSGKTIAFALYLLQRVGKPSGNVQAVVIAPSRELVLQVCGVIRQLVAGLKISPLYGGHAVADEVNTLAVTPDIVVATPGRLLDHIQRGRIDLSSVKTLVLDEYDKSLELGFTDEMSRIVKRMTAVDNIVLTSATRLDPIPAFMPVGKIEMVDFTATTPAPRNRMQIVEVESQDRDKLPTLVELLKSLGNQKIIIFVNHRESAERVYDALLKEKFPVGLYHGGLEQRDRQLALDLLDNGTTPILVSTDLASRGLDIEAVGAVIHYHLPSSAEAWTHRNGRTARQDATGTVYVIVGPSDNLPEYVTFDRPYVPTGESSDPVRSEIATIYFNAGRREKISRGDIAGFLINKGGLQGDEVGKITVSDHSAIAAVPAGKAREVVKAVEPHKLKNTRVRVTQLVAGVKSPVTGKISVKSSISGKPEAKKSGFKTPTSAAKRSAATSSRDNASRGDVSRGGRRR
ncbi:MAG: DEAD/DEAH box helicase [Muribaculaceae bacterium]|nr:DEAD/DEAH box helicase [Muribaculaceae bacterium]